MISRSQMNRQLYQMGGAGMQESQRDAQLSEQLQIEKAYRELVRRGLTEDEARQSIILQLSELKRMDNMPYAPSENNDMYKNMPYAPSENEDMYKNMPYAPSEDNDMYKQEPNLLQPGEYAGENYKGSPDMYPDYEIDFQENNNRQMRQMGGISGMGMQQAPQEMQSMQQMDAEQYRPIAEQLAQDPNQALMTIVKMLMEQGIPEEEAIKIARQMIQSVAEGGMEEVSDDTRIEARFGGRIGYANGGIGTLVDREQYGFGSFVKGVTKAVKGAVKGVTKAVKSVARSPIGRIALTVAAGYYLGPMVSGFSSNPFVQGALRGGLANLAVQAVSGQKINFGEALTSAALGGVTQGLTQGQTGGIDGATDATQGLQGVGLGNPTLTGVPQNAPIFGMDNIPVDSAAPAASASFTSPLTPIASDFDYSNLSSDFDSNVFTDARPGVKSLGSFGTAEASTTFPQGDMVTTPTGFNSEYSRFGSEDTQFGFGKDAIDISNTTPVYKQTSFGKTIGEVETPLSQRYDTFKSALGKGNYLDALKQVSGVALDYPLTTIGGISTLAGAMAPQIPEQLPGESMEEYRARVAEFERQYASNLAGRTGPSLPSSARNPFYPVSAANGGRIGFEGGGIGNVIKQVTQQSFFNQPQMSMMANGGRIGYAGGGSDSLGRRFRRGELSRDEFFKLMSPSVIGRKQYQSAPILAEPSAPMLAKPILLESANNPFYSYPIDVMPARKPDDLNYLEYADGGRIGYAMGNSVQEGIMAAPQIASQMGMPVGNPRMNQGGVPELDYRDEGGFVPPIGIKERADDIPAMLSNNEFVFTANAVKNAGGGDPNVGAQKMYTLMKRLENGGRV